MYDEQMPRTVTIEGQPFVLAIFRIEDRREHDGLPDNLTFIHEDDMVELSADISKNQFALVYVRENTFMKGKKTC